MAIVDPERERIRAIVVSGWLVEDMRWSTCERTMIGWRDNDIDQRGGLWISSGQGHVQRHILGCGQRLRVSCRRLVRHVDRHNHIVIIRQHGVMCCQAKGKDAGCAEGRCCDQRIAVGNNDTARTRDNTPCLRHRCRQWLVVICHGSLQVGRFRKEHGLVASGIHERRLVLSAARNKAKKTG